MRCLALTVAATMALGAATASAQSYCTAPDGSTSLRGMYFPYMYTYYTAPHAPVVAAITVGGSLTGVAVGARCNRLYAEMRTPLWISPRVTRRSGAAGHLHGPLAVCNNESAGTNIFAQAAWRDTKGGLGLTIASRLLLMKKGEGILRFPDFVTYRFYDIPSKRWHPSNDPSDGHGPFRGVHRIARYCCK